MGSNPQLPFLPHCCRNSGMWSKTKHTCAQVDRELPITSLLPPLSKPTVYPGQEEQLPFIAQLPQRFHQHTAHPNERPNPSRQRKDLALDCAKGREKSRGGSWLEWIEERKSTAAVAHK